MEKTFPREMYIAEFLGTAILLLLGLLFVIFMFGEGIPANRIIPNMKLRQVITGFLFGSVGGSIACSALAKKITEAKLYHFDSDQDRLLRRKGLSKSGIRLIIIKVILLLSSYRKITGEKVNYSSVLIFNRNR